MTTFKPLSRVTEGRDNNFNFLRLVFASMVILSHSAELVDGDPHREIVHRLFPTMIGGGMAVCAFFLLSGFLIVQSWHRSPRFVVFLEKRILRICPAFVVAFLISSFIFAPLATHSIKEYFSDFQVRSFMRRLILLWSPPTGSVFAGLHYPSLNGAMWTISTELRCYLLVPLLGMIGFVRRRVIWLLLTIAVAIYFLTSLTSPKFPYHFMLTQIWGMVLPELPQFFPYLLTYFCIGGSFYLFRDKIPLQTKWALAILPLLAVGLLINEQCAQIALMTGGAYLLFWLAFLPVPWLNYFKNHADISYGTYLYGWPVQSLLIWYFPHISPWALLGVALPVSLSFGWVSWHLVEVPFLRMKPRPDFGALKRAPVVPAEPEALEQV